VTKAASLPYLALLVLALSGCSGRSGELASPVAPTAPTAPVTPTAPVNTQPGTDVTTYHNDNGRTGQNLTETTLSPANVNASGFGLLRNLSVDSKVDAEPLYLSQLSIGSSTHNVLFVATEHGSVYAFDSDTGAQLWNVTLLGSGETTSDSRSCSQIVPEIGVTSTPVIDRNAGQRGIIRRG
jgi:outer membrane protein assembly factor BamB